MAAQLAFDFSPPPRTKPRPILKLKDWQDVSDTARQAGCAGTWLLCAHFHEKLDAQALYDVLWTAAFQLSLDREMIAQFSLEIAGEPTRFKVHKTNQATRVGCLEDF